MLLQTSSCVRKYRKYDTAHAVLGHFSRFPNELLIKTAILGHSSYNHKVKVADLVTDRGRSGHGYPKPSYLFFR